MMCIHTEIRIHYHYLIELRARISYTTKSAIVVYDIIRARKYDERQQNFKLSNNRYFAKVML